MSSLTRRVKFLAFFAVVAAACVAAKGFEGASKERAALCPIPSEITSALGAAYYHFDLTAFGEVKDASLQCSLKSNANKDLIGDVWAFIGSVLDSIASGSDIIVQDLLDIAVDLLQQVGQLPAVIGDGLAAALAWIIEVLTGLTPTP